MGYRKFSIPKIILMKESTIQEQIKRELVKKGWIVTKLIQTTTNGIPDLLAMKNGTAIFIEVKRPGQKPTELQKYRHKELRENGFIVLVITSVEELNQYLL